MSRFSLLVIAVLATFPLVAQDQHKVVLFTAQQMERNVRRAPGLDVGEQEINLIEHVPDHHAAILLRRTKPGQAEVHTNETDVWYVMDGGCTLEVGGTEVGGKVESPGQIRGTGISGGTEYTLRKGDFIRIPPGVPHWVKKVNGELVYIVVKYGQ